MARRRRRADRPRAPGGGAGPRRKAEHELRRRNREYGRASATIGRLRAELAREREARRILDRAFSARLRPVDEQRGADEPVVVDERHMTDDALVAAIARYPAGKRVDPADTAKVGDDLGVARLQDMGEMCPEHEPVNFAARCSRERFHLGQHVCTNGGVVVAIWPHENDHKAADVVRAATLRDQTAAIEGAAITLRAHRLDPRGPRAGCTCGWGWHCIRPDGPDKPGYYPGPDELALHIAEQLAAIGALGNHAAAPPDLTDKDGDRWRWHEGYSNRPTGLLSRELVDASHGPVAEADEPEDVPV